MIRGIAATIAIVVLVVLGVALHRRGELRRRFDHDVGLALAQPSVAGALTDGDLASLPARVQRYVRATGAVGRARTRDFHLRFHGEIRSGPDGPWMPFTGEQYNFYDEPSRLFIMDARRRGIPFQALHRYLGASATMRVRIAGLVTVADAKGPEMDVAETVTLFNDLCVFAPGAIAEAPVRWREIDEHRVLATFTNAGHVVTATLVFDDADRLVDRVCELVIADDEIERVADRVGILREKTLIPGRRGLVDAR
jgi:hypothetical protein